MKNHTYLSLFSSAGVGCFGFKQEDFQCITTCEIDKRRLEIQKYNDICNDENGYVCGDISKEEIKEKILKNISNFKTKNSINDVTVLLATPPCQGISVANHKKKNELGRNSLIVESFVLTKKIMPKFFIYENVQSFLDTYCADTNGKLVPIKIALNNNLLGDYFISSKVINLKNYGSNSSRTRTIVIGTRRDQKINPEELFPSFKKTKNVRQLLKNFKKLNSFGKISEDIFHSFRNYNKTMLPWIKDLKEGESAFDNKKITHRPHQIIKGEIVVNKNKNGDKYKRNYWNEIAPYIHTRNDILASQNTIHPSENRVFSIRELMKFMSIPNSFKWSDQSEKKLNQFDVEEKNKFLKKNELNIRRCIGEAVPTKVLNSIAKKIKKFSDVKSIGYQENLKSIKKIIELNKLNTYQNKRKFIAKYFNKLDLDLISKVLEISNPSKDEFSAYFTDSPICIDILNSLPRLKGKIKILEPSVGSGNFLFHIIKKFSHLNEVEIDVFDIDKRILNLLKFTISKLNIPNNIKINFYNKDFLTYNFKANYDLIIGNPPFGKIENKELLNEYKKNKICKSNVNQFSLFLNKALSIGKYVSLILPKSFISSPEHDALRKKIENKNIYSILDFGEYGFKGVKIETINLMLSGKKKENNKIKLFSYINKEFRHIEQDYIIDSKFPYWLLYRNNYFDKITSEMTFDVFDCFRDRQITKKNTSSSGKIRVIKSRNIENNKVNSIKGYDTFIDEIDDLAVSKFLNKPNLYLVPNLTYYPRACKLPSNSITDGSAAILIPKKIKELNQRDLSFYSSKTFTDFYRIARNFGTRSLNIDRNSVYFWGIKKAN